jgi:hypothetical protein
MSTETKVGEKKIKVLQNKKVILKPIEKERPFYKKGHDGEFMFSGCKERFTLPFSQSLNSFIQIFEKGEQEAFEELLQKKPGELNTYTRKNSFWNDFYVDLEKIETYMNF